MIGRWLKRTLATAAVLAVVLLLGALVALWRGIDIDHLAVGPVAAEQVRLALDGKLELAVARLAITPGEDERDAPPEVDDLTLARTVLDAVRWTGRLFSRIEIAHLDIGGVVGDFRFQSDGTGFLNLAAEGVAVELGVSAEGNMLLVHPVRVSLPAYGLEGEGKVSLTLDQPYFEAQWRGVVAGTLPLELAVEANKQQLSFQGRGLEPVATVVPIVELFRLPRHIEVWIADYLQGESFSLDSISGTVPFDAPEEILQSLHAVAEVEDASYTFAEGLPPILAPRARVEFSGGVLEVRAEAPTYAEHDGAGSWLDIDFNDGALLTAYIEGRTAVSSSIVDILDYYAIPFPVLQRDGDTAVELTLRIDLPTVGVQADGRFRAEDSAFEIGGVPFDVPHLDVRLQTTRLRFERLDLQRPGELTLRLAGELDLAARRGDVDIAVLALPAVASATGIELLIPDEKPPVLRYQLRPDSGESIAVPATRWRRQHSRIAVEAFSMPIDFEMLSGTLPAVELSIDRWLRARVSGDVAAAPAGADLQVELLHLRGDNMRLGRRRATIALRAGEALEVATTRAMDLVVKGLPVKVQPTQLRYADGRLRIVHTALQVGNGITARITGDLGLTDGRGHLVLHDPLWQDDYGGTVFDGGGTQRLKFSRDDGRGRIVAEQLGATFAWSPDGAWSLDCPDLERISAFSPVLRYHHLDNGRLAMHSPADATRIDFRGRLRYPYAILVQGDSPVEDYDFRGWFDGRAVQLTLNDRLRVDLGRQVTIESQGVGFNMKALVDLFGAEDEAVAEDKDEVTPLRLRMRARDSFAWLGENVRVPADRLVLHYADERLKVDLQHGAGFATLEVEDEQLKLIGRGFGERFSRSLLAPFGDLEGGRLDFQAQGDLPEIEAVVHLSDVLIRDYKQLNNMLALVNTVPGLITFNPPRYDRDGLPVEELYTKLTFRQGRLDLQSLLIDSRELTIRGDGFMDFNDDTTDMTFNLVLGAKKSIARIPLLGYILTGGEEKPSVTLRVAGDLQDPDVSHTTFEEVVTYPFHVLARTILLPEHMVRQAQQRSH